MQPVSIHDHVYHKTDVKYILVILLLYLFIFNEPLADFVPAFQYMDELVALLAIPVFLLQKRGCLRIKKNDCGVYLLGFVICGLAGNIIYKLQLFVYVLADLLLCLKFWLTLYVGRTLFQNIRWEKYIKNLYFHVRIVIWIYIICTIMDRIWNVFGMADVRYGIRSLRIFYSHPVHFAGYSTFLIVILIAIREKVSGTTKYMLLLMCFTCLSLRSTAFASTVLFLILYYLICLRRKKINVRMVSALAVIAVLVGWSQIYYYFFSSIREDSARAQLLIKSFQIAADHFTGTGFGTYASYYSGINYSPVYAMYNLEGIHGLVQGAADFISDSFWPALLGQTGYIGTIFYVLSIIMLFLKIQKLRLIDKNSYCSALCTLAYLIIMTMSLSSFFNPIAMPFALWLGILLSDGNNGFIHRHHIED